jgi:hypothetical protein
MLTWRKMIEEQKSSLLAMLAEMLPLTFTIGPCNPQAKPRENVH